MAHAIGVRVCQAAACLAYRVEAFVFGVGSQNEKSAHPRQELQ